MTFVAMLIVIAVHTIHPKTKVIIQDDYELKLDSAKFEKDSSLTVYFHDSWNYKGKYRVSKLDASEFNQIMLHSKNLTLNTTKQDTVLLYLGNPEYFSKFN